MPLIILICFILFIFCVWWGIKWRRKRNREALKSAAFNPSWVLILQNNITLYNKLPENLKHRLHGLINVFLYEKSFHGYNGLQINDDIKVTIASQACMLLLNRDDDIYPSLKNILVYPDAFKSMQTESDGTVETVKEIVRIGESWRLGHVVLSWRHSKLGAMDEDDGHNVVYHEFAHQLDHEDGAIDGTPVLDSANSYDQWAKIFSHEYIRLMRQTDAGQKSLIDAYGAVSEGEFFAVVTELFFERPKLLSLEHPELYQELSKYYRLNPLEWL